MKKDILECINDNKNMILKLASKYSGYYNIEDLYQAGVIGVINAYKNFKENKNAKFSTYAYRYILGEIIEYIKNDRTIKISSDYLKIYKTYTKTKELLSQKLSRIPNNNEIALFMEIPYIELIDVISSCEFVMSLDNEVMGEEDISFLGLYGEDNRENIDNKILVNSAFDSLNELDQKIIDYRYFQDYTQSETAKYLGISQVQVSRREQKALTLMKHDIAC
ncbi:MAG: sigma-70 family RNA polymerase sigma factor [Bacilli bacterium]